MNNSIWHDKNEKPVKVLHKNYIIITKWGSVLSESDVDSGYTIETDWAYLEEILAQADKAERLKKENEAMREEFEVWHENYKCEVEEKERLEKALMKIATASPRDKASTLIDIACIALTPELEEGTTNDK